MLYPEAAQRKTLRAARFICCGQGRDTTPDPEDPPGRMRQITGWLRRIPMSLLATKPAKDSRPLALI
jgi:hypothetical protein